MKTPYTLSKDYNKLYDLVCEGYEIPCYVDYDWNRTGDMVRDICICRKLSEFNIQFSARGIGYGGVDPWLYDNKFGYSEKDLFIKVCEQKNLEYIEVRE